LRDLQRGRFRLHACTSGGGGDAEAIQARRAASAWLPPCHACPLAA
jgi:hypothetical protein